MKIITSWKMSDQGRSTGRWWEATTITDNSALELRFKLHPGKDTQNPTVAVGFPSPPTNSGKPITSLDKELAEVTDFRVATVASRDEAIRLGNAYLRAKNSGSQGNVQAFFNSVSWKATGKPGSLVSFRSGPGERGLLMIVDWVEGKTLDLDADVYQ